MATLLAPLSPASASAVVGESWTLRFRTVDEFGHATGAVTPVLAVVLPDGSASVPVAGEDVSIGDWVVRIVLAQAGRWTAHVSTPEDALDMAAYAVGPTTPGGMPTVNDVALYLGANAGTWSQTQLAEVLAGERDAQRAKCGERANYPDALRQALLRRCARALAMRRMPLAVNFGDADGSGSLVLPGRDPEVRRLEGPYRRLVVG
jgi:hypothetical protein